MSLTKLWDLLVLTKVRFIGAVERLLTDKLDDYVSVKDFGAKCDGVTDDTEAVKAAIAACGKVYFPEGVTRVTSQITISKVTYLAGDGRGVSIIEWDSPTSNGLMFDLNFAQGGGLKQLTLAARNDTDPQGVGSSGVGLHVRHANDNFLCDDFEVLRFGTSCRTTACYQPFFTNFRFLYFSDAGIHLAPYLALPGESAGNGCQFHKGKISNNGYTGNTINSVGIHIQYGSGEFFSYIDVQVAGIPVLVNPPATSWVRYLWMNTVLADSGMSDGFYFDGNAAEVGHIFFDSCWSSNNVNNGVTTVGANLYNLRWQGGTIRGNRDNGLNYRDGRFVSFDGVVINNNSNGQPYVFPGVYINGNTSQLSLNNCIIGNLPDKVANLHQGSGIVIEQGTSEALKITNCDLRAYGTGKQAIEYKGTITRSIIDNNLPLQTGGTNPQTIASINLASYNPVQANKAVYLTAGGTGTVSQGTFMSPVKGLISSVIVSAAVLPGNNQSFTYTLYVNGNPVGIGMLTNNYLLKFNTPQLVEEGDSLAFQVTTSASAAQSEHRAVINFSK